MKVANKKPKEVKSPVRITDDKYELWYSRPVCLGAIEKRNGYWYTADGMRFVSSRDALEYAIRLTEAGGTLAARALAVPEQRPPVVKKGAPVAAVTKKKKQVTKKTPAGDHPLFQKFLDFLQKQEEAQPHAR